MNPDWHLLDGEQQHRETPKTFWMPPRAEREGLVPGKVVKIDLVTDLPGEKVSGERFWVTIRGSGVEKMYLGQVSNDLEFTAKHWVKGDDFIEFGPEHILQTEQPPPGARPPRLFTAREMHDFLALKFPPAN